MTDTIARYRHRVFARQYELSEPDVSRNGDREWYGERLAGREGRVLELGAGTGRVTRYLLSRGIGPIALDIGAAMLERLARRQVESGGPSVALVAGDLRALPIATGTISTAFAAYNALGCIVEPGEIARAFEEVHRVLVSGGTMLFDVMEVCAADFGTGARRFGWERWSAGAGDEIHRRTSVRLDRDRDLVEMRYEYRWRMGRDRWRAEDVTFRLSAWPLERWIEAARAAGFTLVDRVERLYEIPEGPRRGWGFVELRR